MTLPRFNHHPTYFDSRAEFYENKKMFRGIHQDCLLSGVKPVLIKSRLRVGGKRWQEHKQLNGGESLLPKVVRLAIVCLTVR